MIVRARGTVRCCASVAIPLSIWGTAAVAVGQAIGRFGNYFNQELFGRPTTLPWGLKIDLAHRPAGYTQYATFHPTFLYESVWCLLVFGAIVLAERRVGLRKGQAFAMYVCCYTLGRTWFESLRIDKATRVFGVRFNLLVSAGLCVAAGVWFVVLASRTSDGAEGPDDAVAVAALER